MSLHFDILHSHLIIVTLDEPLQGVNFYPAFHLPLVYGMYTFEDYSSVNILYTPSKTTAVVLASLEQYYLFLISRPALFPFPS